MRNVSLIDEMQKPEHNMQEITVATSRNRHDPWSETAAGLPAPLWGQAPVRETVGAAAYRLLRDAILRGEIATKEALHRAILRGEVRTG